MQIDLLVNLENAAFVAKVVFKKEKKDFQQVSTDEKWGTDGQCPPSLLDTVKA